jgi:hypothetical protein
MKIRTYEQDAPSIIDRLLIIECVKDGRELEKALIARGYGKRNLVVNWVARNKVSQSFLETYTAREGISLDWLVHGRGSRSIKIKT